MGFYLLYLRIYRFQRYAEIYLRYYSKFYWWKFFLILNDFFNKRIHFLQPLPDIGNLKDEDEFEELAKLERGLRIRYLRFQTYDWSIKYRMARLVDKSGETRQMREIFEQIDESFRLKALYYHQLWQEARKAKETKLDSQDKPA